MNNSKINVPKIAQLRAATNSGGILLTVEQTKSDHNGRHYRTLLDGGNYCNGRALWVLGRASGGGYDVQAAALAEAVRAVIGGDAIRWHNRGEWQTIAQEAGWTLFVYGDAAVVLIPSAQVAQQIMALINR